MEWGRPHSKYTPPNSYNDAFDARRRDRAKPSGGPGPLLRPHTESSRQLAQREPAVQGPLLRSHGEQRQSAQRMHPIEGFAGLASQVYASACYNVSSAGATPQVSRKHGTNFSPRHQSKMSASAATPAPRDNYAMRIEFKSKWPDLHVDARSANAAKQWYTNVEGPLSQAMTDAQCPYTWLDPRTSGALSLDEVLPIFDAPYTFADFQKDWDFPDKSYFKQWCEERKRGSMAWKI